MPTEKKELYLTFDDGPIPGPTEFVLEVLQKAYLKATFFCIGDNIYKHPHIFNTVVAQGHTVANHTYNHLDGWKTSVHQYRENAMKCHAEICKQIGNRTSPPLFRPPYGKIKLAQIRAMADHRIVMWDVLAMDFNKQVSAEVSLKNTLAATRNGSIIIFHDSLKAEKKMSYMLPRFIDHFAGQGYTFNSLL